MVSIKCSECKDAKKKDILIYGINYTTGGLFILYMAVRYVKPTIFSLINLFMVFVGANIFTSGLTYLKDYLMLNKQKCIDKLVK